MSTLNNDLEADAAMKALAEMFSGLKSGKSIYSGIRYDPKIQNGTIVFIPNADDVAFHKAFDEVLKEIFEIPEASGY